MTSHPKDPTPWTCVARLQRVITIFFAVVLIACSSGDSPTGPPQGCEPNCNPPLPPPPPPAASPYTAAAPLPRDRRAAPAAALNGRIYVPGGWTTPAQTYLASMDVYDPATDRWETAPPMPELRNDHATIAVAGKLYVIGGWKTVQPHFSYALTMLEFDPVTAAWSTKAAPPQALIAPAAAALNGKIYLFGGWSTDGSLNSTYIYDVATGNWSEGAQLPLATEGAGAAVLGSTIYVVGGANASGLLDAVQAYEPEHDRWTLRAPLLQPRSGHGVTVLNGRIYTFGGQEFSGGVLSLHPWAEYYDATRNIWIQARPMEHGRSRMGIAAVSGKIHLLGGLVAGGWSTSHLTFEPPAAQ